MAMRIGPEWRVPILPGAPPSAEPAPPSVGSSDIPATDALPVAAVEVPRVVSVALSPNPPLAPEAQAIVATRRTSRIAPGPVRVPRAPATVALPWRTSDVLMAAWAFGFVAALLPTLVGLVVGEVRRRRA